MRVCVGCGAAITKQSKTGRCRPCARRTRWRQPGSGILSSDRRAATARAYNKQPTGLLVRSYRNMLSRVRGVQHKKAHLYLGLSVLPKEVFYLWAKASPDFLRLYEAWRVSDFQRRLTPSVNRIDTTKGYDLDNIEWITHGENSAEGSRSLARQRRSGVMR